MAFKRPTLPELLTRIDQDLLSRLPGAQAELAVRTTKALAAADAGAVHGLYGYLQWLERQLFPESCDDENLSLHSAGVPRRQPAFSVGRVVFEGTDTIVIQEGTLVQRGGHEYTVTEEATISGGQATAPVRAVETGAAGDQPAGAQLSLVSPLHGVASQATVDSEGIRGGADLETYGSWRDRIMRRRARVPRGGAQGDWEGWALDVPGVTRAWEDPLGMGPGSVVVRIMADDASDGPLPSAQLLQAVWDYIESQKNVQAHVYVVAPIAVPFIPQLSVTPNTEQVRGAASQALQDLVEREGEPGGTLLISRIRSAISLAAGVEDYDLPWPTGNVPHDTGELPTWGGVQWIEG
ncbi:baseplate J/gp47 family protein [Bordetella petrii]|uniref:Tail protein, putative n=1 Tax=Bordetella petrii (strain ATCC BAA-461 / DSM 12804 / CCUG 43448 / CIP 107267 / Se-1111R) TaxID=340100 RepID=A9ID84_BORPD|nr:baseplate J/gp47 family protein [Bordetella petrii]CAP44778.1 tail protein, putative [Bordetella petrii]